MGSYVLLERQNLEELLQRLGQVCMYIYAHSHLWVYERLSRKSGHGYIYICIYIYIYIYTYITIMIPLNYICMKHVYMYLNIGWRLYWGWG
jgi:hypothetical protein